MKTIITTKIAGMTDILVPPYAFTILSLAMIFGALSTLAPLQKVAAQIPDSFTNLKTSPIDISKKELISMMKGHGRQNPKAG